MYTFNAKQAEEELHLQSNPIQYLSQEKYPILPSSVRISNQYFNNNFKTCVFGTKKHENVSNRNIDFSLDKVLGLFGLF